MTPTEAIRLGIIVGVPVMLTRIIVGLSRPMTWVRVWTWLLPTIALLLLFVRISITQNVEGVFPSDDRISAASWVFVVATQAIATLVQWVPPILADALRRRVLQRVE